ncbi:type I-E CRISPR-associated protein Cse2/CasB [Hydrogenophilus islandicus]
MSDHAASFIAYLIGLQDRDRAALAHLKRSLAFDPGAYPQAYPYVERFVGAECHAEDPHRLAMYLTAGLFALHPLHQEGSSLAAALGRVGRNHQSGSIEERFIALLSAEAESLPTLLRQCVSLLAADGVGCDYAQLLADLTRLLDPWNLEARDRVRQRWARDFYRAFEAADGADAALLTTEPELEL